MHSCVLGTGKTVSLFLHSAGELRSGIHNLQIQTKKIQTNSEEKPTSSRNKVTEISGVEGLWKSLLMKRISSNAPTSTWHSRRKSSITNFESAWGQRTSWCVNYIINSLSEKFDEGLQYRTLNSLRSAISAYHVNVDGKSMGKHSKVRELLTGIFNQRPPQPRYVLI